MILLSFDSNGRTSSVVTLKLRSSASRGSHIKTPATAWVFLYLCEKGYEPQVRRTRNGEQERALLAFVEYRREEPEQASFKELKQA